MLKWRGLIDSRLPRSSDSGRNEMTSLGVQIENSIAVTSLLGEWSDLHDAQIVRLALDSDGAPSPTLELDLVLPANYSALFPGSAGKPHLRLVLRFGRVLRLRLADFWPQNVILEFTITPYARRTMRVMWTRSVGCEASFLCDTATVVQVARVDVA